jgi:hypothetical protein
MRMICGRARRLRALDPADARTMSPGAHGVACMRVMRKRAGADSCAVSADAHGTPRKIGTRYYSVQSLPLAHREQRTAHGRPASYYPLASTCLQRSATHGKRQMGACATTYLRNSAARPCTPRSSATYATSHSTYTTPGCWALTAISRPSSRWTGGA